MQLSKKLIAFIKIFRPHMWVVALIVTTLFLIIFQRQTGIYSAELMGTVVLTVILITSGGVAFDDYCDRESDAIVYPDRPLPSNQLSPSSVVVFSAMLFVTGFFLALTINLVAFYVAIVAIVFAILYPSFFKRRSGFLSHFVMAFLVGMVPVFCEAAVSKTITFRSLSFLGAFLWVVSFDVFRDVLGLEGDVKAGIPTLAVKRGTRTATKVGAVMLPVAAIMTTIPYFLEVVGIAYIIPTALLDCIFVYLALSLFTRPDVQNVKRQSQTLFKSLVLCIIAFVGAAFL